MKKKTYCALLALLTSSAFAASSSTSSTSGASKKELIRTLLTQQTIQRPVMIKSAQDTDAKAFQLVAEIGFREEPLSLFCLEGHPDLLTFITQNEDQMRITYREFDPGCYRLPNERGYNEPSWKCDLAKPDLKAYASHPEPHIAAERLLQIRHLAVHHVNQNRPSEIDQQENRHIACTLSAYKALHTALVFRVPAPTHTAQQMLIQSKEPGLFLTN